MSPRRSTALDVADDKGLIADGGSKNWPGNSHNGSRPTEKDSEFVCERCHSRCTESPVDGTEYGHRRGCPRRPDINRYVNGPGYDPEDDPLVELPDPQALTDGGDRCVD